MFNQQQQQFHQLMQLQQLLQQQQQQHTVQHQHQAPRPMQPPVQHQQPQQMLNLTAANPARLLNAHPMLQRALLMQQMQGNIRGLSMGAPPMPHFFSAAARQSILGTPPLGVTVKAPRMGFPSMPFQQHHRMYQKDHYRSYDRKREGGQASSIQSKDNDNKLSNRVEAELPPAASEADESVGSPEDSENLTECSIIDPLEPSAKKARSSSANDVEEAAFPAGGTTEEGDGKRERSVESKSTEGGGGGRALKVTIQQRSESRTISTTMLKPKCSGSSSPRFCCYICKSNFHSLQPFQSHLLTARHQQKLKEIQQLSNACLVTLMPTAKDGQGSAAGIDGKKQSKWCNVCQIHFSSDLIKHRRTQEHKMAKRSLRPFCTVCSRHFKTPRKFVEHMKSPEHKEKTQEARLREKEPWTLEESEELITVDAVGCFEDEDDDDEEEEEGISEDDSSADTECLLTEDATTGFAEHEEWDEYSADTAYGLDFIVPVAGYLCRLCHKFYPSDSAARLLHCKSLTHYQNVQKYKASKSHTDPQVESGPYTKIAEIQGDEGALPISGDKPCTLLDQSDAGPAALQGEPEQGCGTLQTESQAGQGDGNLALMGESENNSIASGGSKAAIDLLVATSEEDAGYLLESETLLLGKNLESDSAAGISMLQEENSTTQNDSASLSNRRSSRHRHQ
ncbi:cip1-interacting zinc finger isoform X3 [Pelobates cultripes]|uniref:Cip1-interacting zinc finger isoform X3 n=1 Tax=Pelobates cultripes TaxID=61616 RepID=A0AAD1T418_PELCU|nr:cip1-interacting zinc finger isoform X3 [Pelobates cultripes]